jgi:hypothetical protein
MKWIKHLIVFKHVSFKKRILPAEVVEVQKRLKEAHERA